MQKSSSSYLITLTAGATYTPRVSGALAGSLHRGWAGVGKEASAGWDRLSGSIGFVGQIGLQATIVPLLDLYKCSALAAFSPRAHSSLATVILGVLFR
jgi:hypothetical protein